MYLKWLKVQQALCIGTIPIPGIEKISRCCICFLYISYQINKLRFRKNQSKNFFPHHMPHLQDINILVADDNNINQTLMVKALSALGYKADVVSTGTDAVTANKEHHYDLVLMDYQMPEMDGAEAAQCIKENGQAHKPVIILMTANLLVSTDHLSHHGIFDGFLKKPFTMEELAGTIEKWRPRFQQAKSAKRG